MLQTTLNTAQTPPLEGKHSAVIVPKNIAAKCPKCKEIHYERDLKRKFKVCPRCNYHFRLTAYERIEFIMDPESFVEVDADIASADPLHFVNQSQIYAEKLQNEQLKTHLNEGVVIGHATIERMPLALAVMDFRFIGGSMGAAVGEKITRSIELAIERRSPVLIVSTSGGALARLGEAGLPYFSLLTDPTTGGVTASFAMLGDVILAEPGGLICFAGPRVIEQFIHIQLPKDAVTAEFAHQHGLIDAVVPRYDLRQTLARLLRLYSYIQSFASKQDI